MRLRLHVKGRECVMTTTQSVPAASVSVWSVTSSRTACVVSAAVLYPSSDSPQEVFIVLPL